MRNTKRFFISLFIAIFTMSMLAGCGGNTAATSGTTATTESKDKEPVVIDSNGEGAVQGGIKSDEEIAALQEEEAAFAAESEAAESSQPAEFEDNSGHEPEAYGSGNFQDYWEGENYFDLVAYMTDNGYVDFHKLDSYYNFVKDGEQVEIYECTSGDYMWVISFTSGTLVVRYLGGNENNSFNGPNYYCTFYNQDSTIKVDNTGLMSSISYIQALDIIVQNIKANPNNQNPTEGTNFDTIDNY